MNLANPKFNSIIMNSLLRFAVDCELEDRTVSHYDDVDMLLIFSQ